MAAEDPLRLGDLTEADVEPAVLHGGAIDQLEVGASAERAGRHPKGCADHLELPLGLGGAREDLEVAVALVGLRAVSVQAAEGRVRDIVLVLEGRRELVRTVDGELDATRGAVAGV